MEKKKMAGILKKVLDSRLAWDLFQSPFYNKVVAPTAAKIVGEMIDTINTPIEGFTVLDVGCGSGLSTCMIAKKKLMLQLLA